MTRVRGESLRQSGTWSVLPAQPIPRATGSRYANAFIYALYVLHVTFYGWVPVDAFGARAACWQPSRI
jgi:hypothetical protein